MNYLLHSQRRNGPFRLEVEYIKAINTNVRVLHRCALILCQLMGRGKYAAARVYKKSFLRNMDEEEGLFDLEDPTKQKQEKK